MKEFQGIKAFRLEDDKLFTGGIGGSKRTEFEEDKIYSVDGEPKLCKNGFHFYETKNACFGANLFDKNTVYHEIIALNKVISDTEKCVATKIKIGKRINLELDENHNSGYRNSGYFNSGSKNSGDYNSGNLNSGDENSGDFNSGNKNSGNCNSGYRNSGSFNSGYKNSGDNNSGDYNFGHYNSGNCNSGNGHENYFCNKKKYFLFNVEVSEETIQKVKRIPMYWFSLENKSYKNAWKSCPIKVLELFRNIPEFQTQEAKEIFEDITDLEL